MILDEDTAGGLPPLGLQGPSGHYLLERSASYSYSEGEQSKEFRFVFVFVFHWTGRGIEKVMGIADGNDGR